MELPADFSPLRISTDDLPARDRVPAWREHFGRYVFRTEIEPARDVPFCASFTLRRAPGLDLVRSHMSPGSFSRTPMLVADGNDDVGFVVSSSGGGHIRHGREVAFGAGEAVLATAADVAQWIVPSAAHYVCVHVRRAEIKPLVADLASAMARGRVPRNSTALQYLLGFIRFLQESPQPLAPDVAGAAADHVRDLFALLLGPTRDAAAVAEGRGLRAARLQAIKRYVADNLHDGTLTVETVAARHRLSPRSVQRLFEGEGSTFSEYVLNRRLDRARGMLADPAYAGWTVSAVALEAGFGDVSYFNRRFRRRYGMRPSDVRAQGAI